MKGSIRRITRERLEERGNAIVPSAWVRNGHGGRTWNGGTWLTKQTLAQARTDDAPVIVMLGANGTANAMLAQQAIGATRAYALVGPETELRGLLGPNVLVRRVPEVPASALHSATEARLWIGGEISLKLDPRQAEALRLTFLRLFWHEAIEEAWLDGKQLVWRTARQRPFDVPEVPAAAVVRWDPADAKLDGAVRGATVHLTAGEPPAIAPRRLWFPAGAQPHAQLAKLAENGAEVLWEDLQLPDLMLGDTSGEALLPGTRGRLRIRLTTAQMREARALLDADAAWRFCTNVRIGDPKLRRASFWLAGEVAPREVEDEQVIDLPSVQAMSLRDVHASEPSSVPSPQPLALAVRYRWPVVPPRIPAGSEEDQLVKRWRSLDDEWVKRLAIVRDALETSKVERSRLGTAFSRLMSALLGFQRKHDELWATFLELEPLRLSEAGSAEAPRLLARLEKLEAETRSHLGDLEGAERQAREDEEQEKQRAEWMAQVERAKTDVARLRAEVERESTRERELEDEAKAIEERLKDATPADQKDLEVKRLRNRDDRKANEKRLKKLRHDLAMREKDAGRPFTYNSHRIPAKAPQLQGKRFVPTSTGGRIPSSVPDDALPDVGRLRAHKGLRYLVIDDWEHLDVGEQAASRLSAKLVAPEDV